MCILYGKYNLLHVDKPMTTKLKVTLPFSTLNTTHSTYMYSKHAFFNIFGPIMSVLIDTLLETVFIYLF